MDLGLIRTIFLLYGILSVIYAIALLLHLDSSKKSVIAYWSSGVLLLGLATLLTVFRHEGNLLITQVGANTIAFVGNILLGLSLRVALGHALQMHLVILYNSMMGIAYYMIFVMVGSSLGPQYQTVFLSIMMGLTHFYAAYYAYKIYCVHQNKHALTLSGAFLLGALAWLTRVVLIFFDIGSSVFDTTILNTIIFSMIFTFGIMRYFFFYGILYSQENIELFKVNTLLDEKNELLQELSEEKIKSEKANLAKGLFLANVSHEIRTPLHGLIGLVSMTLKSTMPEEVRQSLNKALYSSKALLVILNDILDFSKIEAEMIEINHEPFNVKHLIDDVRDLFSIPATEKGIELRFDIDTSLPEVVMGDFYKLRQVLFNLVGNSIKFTLQGYIEVIVQADEITEGSVRLTITVKDSGIGISEKDLEVIFKPFYQLDNSNSRSYDGVGLGLPITQNILLKMGSKLQMKSQPGLGSESTFQLLLEINHQVLYKHRTLASYSKTAGSALSYASLSGCHVLVAEDNLINIEVIRRYLKHLNIEAHFVTDGQQSLEALKNNTYDCVLMDIQMPILDGFNTTYQIRLMEPLKDLPIIGLSAGVAESDREKALQSGMNDFIVKPFEVEELANILIKYIR
jgi:signal transduction histidine kinase/CheY-like chemotaxis protein